MARITKEKITGNKGEDLAQLLLGTIADVKPPRTDIGLDFKCELWDDPNAYFFVQAKGSPTPIYTKTTIRSLPIECKTIEEYWLKKDHPVFVLMSDTYYNRTYYIRVDPETSYKPTRDEQKTCTFSIPLCNLITHDNIGRFHEVVMQNQPYRSQEELERSIEEHWQKHPELYHDLDEIDRFLEVMRGSDQEAQMEVRLLLKQWVKTGAPISPRLVQGLVPIFINCKDRITQNHVLNALVILNEHLTIPELVSEVLKQIERNMRLYEYRRHSGEGWRSPYTDFLFYALVRLKDTNIIEELKHFLRVGDLAVNRNAIRACGWLKLDKTTKDILRFLGHPDDGVRYDVAQALGQMSLKKVTRELKKVLRTSQDKLQIAGAIQALAEFGSTQDAAEVTSFAKDPSRDVRRAVASYLGAIDPVGHIDLLLHMMVDDNDHKVRSAAMQSVHKCLPVAYPDEFEELEAPVLPQGPTMTVEELERRALPLLKEAYENQRIPQAASLLPFCKGSRSLSTLVHIYLDENGPSRKTYEFKGPMRDVELTQEVHLKPMVLNVLKQYDPSEIPADVAEQINAHVVEHIGSADTQERHYYITAAGEMKLKAAFEPITTLISGEKVKHKHLVVSALASIDSAKARAWAVETLRSNPSLKVSLVCFDTIHQASAEEEDDDLVKAQILRLMNDANIRQNRQIYDYVDRYEVTEAAPLIVNDLRAGEEPIELALFARMLKTLAVLKTPEGRDVLIDSLEIVGDGLKYRIIAYLGDIGDSKSINAVREYSDYPDPEISKLVKKILDSAESGK